MMRWLRNVWFRSVWKVRRLLRLKDQTIAPIQWEEPLLTSCPDTSLHQNLDAIQKRRLQMIVEEAKTISMLTRYFPSNISNENWITLLECQTRNQRLQYLKFLRRKELEREKDLQKKRQKKEALRPPIKQRIDDFPLYFPATKLAIDERLWAWQKVANAYRCGAPTLVVDCRFLPLLSPRGAHLTAVQLQYLISENRDSREPWQLYLSNFDHSLDRMRRLKQKYLTVVDSEMTCGPIISPHNFTALFEKERIIYLSPDAEEEVGNVDENDVYVVGGIVDRVVEKEIPRQASLQTALAEGVRCRKLPLDKHVVWKSGSKFLTLTAVSSILREVYSSGGNWEAALRRNIPVRNVRSAEEKSTAGRILHGKIRQFDRQLLSILDRELGKEKTCP